MNVSFIDLLKQSEHNGDYNKYVHCQDVHTVKPVISCQAINNKVTFEGRWLLNNY